MNHYEKMSHQMYETGADFLDEETFSLIPWIRYLLSKWWIFLLTALLGAGLGFGYSRLLVTPEYEAVSRLYVANRNEDLQVSLNDLQIASSMVNDYMALMKNRTLLESVIQDLGLDLSPSELSGQITISNPAGTRQICIYAVNPDASAAAAIANQLAENAVSYLPEITGSVPPVLVEEASVPHSPAVPRTSKNVLLGAAAGGMLCGIVCTLRFFTDDTFRNAEDLYSQFGQIPLAEIPEERKAGRKKRKARFRR